MSLKRVHRLASAVGVAAIVAASGASASLVYLPGDNALFHGPGPDAAQAAAAATVIGASATSFANMRNGSAATLTDVTGGPGTLIVANATQAAAVPELPAYALLLVGLAGIGFTVRRRMR